MGALDGKTALVTGGSRGIGRGIVERLARDGASVVFSFASNKAAADDVKAVTAGGLGRVEAVAADLADRWPRVPSTTRPRPRWGRWTFW